MNIPPNSPSNVPDNNDQTDPLSPNSQQNVDQLKKQLEEVKNHKKLTDEEIALLKKQLSLLYEDNKSDEKAKILAQIHLKTLISNSDIIKQKIIETEIRIIQSKHKPTEADHFTKVKMKYEEDLRKVEKLMEQHHATMAKLTGSTVTQTPTQEQQPLAESFKEYYLKSLLDN